jgi:short-subunit dehydrogenase
MKIKDNCFIVTGSGNGIGREVAIKVLEKGGRVAAVDINQQALEATKELAKDYQSNLSIHQCDLADLNQVEQLKDEVLKHHPTIDGLINVAGIIQPFIPIIELDYQKIHQVMNVNFYGTLHMIKTFLPILLERPVAHITNVSSMGAYVPVPGQSIYGASKAAVEMMTLGLHSELKDTSVGVTLVLPGGVATDIVKNSGVRMDALFDQSSQSKYKLLNPQKAAELIVDATEKNKYRIPIGTDAKFMNFMSRFFLKKAANMIAKKLGDVQK